MDRLYKKNQAATQNTLTEIDALIAEIGAAETKVKRSMHFFE